MSKKRRRGSKPAGQRSPSERLGNKASGGRVTASTRKASAALYRQDKAKGSTFTSGDQAMIITNDGVEHLINDGPIARSQPKVADLLPPSENQVDWDAGETGLEVFNIPREVNALAHWKATGEVPKNADGTSKKIALRLDRGTQPVASRVSELIAQLREDGTTDMADYIAAGHWFDAMGISDEDLMAQGYGHVMDTTASSGITTKIVPRDGDDVSWARVPNEEGLGFDPDFPHTHFSNYIHVASAEASLSDYDAADMDWRRQHAPDMFSHRMGYHKDAPRDLNIPVDADGDHMLSHGDGCALAHAIHRDALDFWQSKFGQSMAVSFFVSQGDPAANLTFPFPPDTTVDTAPAYMAKRLAGAQVMWVDQMMAEVIDAGADLLWQEGVEHDSWPVTTAEDMEVFDNVFIVSINKDEYGTWPNVKWGTIGYTTGGSPKTDWVDYQPGDKVPFRKQRGLYWIQMSDWMLPCTESILEFDAARQRMSSETVQVLAEVLKSLRERGEATAEHRCLPGWIASSGCLAVSVAARSFFDYITKRPLQEVHVPRAMRRNAERKHGTIRPTIKIVTLPRAPHRPGKHNKTDRKLTCQFWVDEHRRYQHYPSLGQAYHDDGEWNKESHKPILIPGYVKGPEDRPWKASKGTVYRLAKKQEQRGTL